uniref:Uncharacterized protein n=1 Tax=Utricularia reniformis TaxID=192314 RepID=A0A1Y0B476_9LAMI|nr:hypothetical protein AEK19_MT2043 [Utricularia reniformis]ART32200.1 hypothetical protein AEK19_MT2043 [Utricularia reniformis]
MTTSVEVKKTVNPNRSHRCDDQTCHTIPRCPNSPIPSIHLSWAKDVLPMGH